MTAIETTGKGKEALNRMEKLEITGKGRKALNRLRAANSEVKEMIGILHVVSTNIIKIFKDDKFRGDIGIELKPRPESSKVKPEPPKLEFLKLRGMIVELPRRIEVMCNGLRFYIDFTLLASEGDDPSDIKGSIVYGVSRTLCFQTCIFLKDADTCKRCERIKRCDGLEDKPMIQFTVNRHGIVKSRGELDDEWRIEDPKQDEEKLKEITKSLHELHYRALDHIWKDALDWTNENILP